jgi:hypothetical protein
VHHLWASTEERQHGYGVVRSCDLDRMSDRSFPTRRLRFKDAGCYQN